MDCHWEWIATLTLNDDDDHGLSLQNGWPTKPSLSMKPAGTFVKGFHHRKSPRHREKYLNLFRTWVQILMNKNVKAAVTTSTQLHYNRMSLTHFSPVLNFIKTPVIKIQLWAGVNPVFETISGNIQLECRILTFSVFKALCVLAKHHSVEEKPIYNVFMLKEASTSKKPSLWQISHPAYFYFMKTVFLMENPKKKINLSRNLNQSSFSNKLATPGYTMLVLDPAKVPGWSFWQNQLIFRRSIISPKAPQ